MHTVDTHFIERFENVEGCKQEGSRTTGRVENGDFAQLRIEMLNKQMVVSPCQKVLHKLANVEIVGDEVVNLCDFARFYFRFDAGVSGAVYETFLSMKDSPGERWRFTKGSQKFQTFAMMKTGKVNWWPSDWVCSFKRQLIPAFPLNKIFVPWRPPKSASIVAFHGQPDLPQALEGYYRKYDKPAKMHLTCKPTKWILEYWHE